MSRGDVRRRMGYSPTNEVSLQIAFTAHQHLPIQIVRETDLGDLQPWRDRQTGSLFGGRGGHGGGPMFGSPEMAAGREVKIVRLF